MITRITIFADFEEKKSCAVFYKRKEFDSETDLRLFINNIMVELEKIYEQSTPMEAKIVIEELTMKNSFKLEAEKQ